MFYGGGRSCHITLLKTHSQTQVGVVGVGGDVGWFLYIFVCVSCVSDEVLLRGGWLCHITLLKTHSQTQIGVVGVGGGGRHMSGASHAFALGHPHPATLPYHIEILDLIQRNTEQVLRK